MSNNPGYKFDEKWMLKQLIVKDFNSLLQLETNIRKKQLDDKSKLEYLMLVLSIVDLTSLTGNETPHDISDLCFKAFHPLPAAISEKLKDIQCAAVCVYSKMIKSAVEAIEKLKTTQNMQMKIASVAGGFPNGTIPLDMKLKEIEDAIKCGAEEIDVVINRNLARTQNWSGLFDEIASFKEACKGQARLKVILCTGELGGLNNVYCASMVAMFAGADFIKTSTGKEQVNATIPVGIVMCEAIKDYRIRTGQKVGIKPAGGIKTCEDALAWVLLIKDQLGDDWMNPQLFRIGASSLLDDIRQTLTQLVD